MADPARPARRNAISTGPSSFVIESPTIGPRMSWLPFETWSAAWTTRTMPTKSERRAPIQSVSVPTRTICAATRPRSASAAGARRTAAMKSVPASPSTWRTSRMPAPRRATGPSGRRAPTASIATARLEVPRAAEATVLARDEAPGRVPVARAVGARVPADDAVERRPQVEDAPVLREEAVRERERLAVAAAVVACGADDRKRRHEPLVTPRCLVREPLPPPEEEADVAAEVVEVVDVLRLRPVRGPRVEPRVDPTRLAPTVNGKRPPDAVRGRAEVALAHHERPRRRRRLDAGARVDGMEVCGDPVSARRPLRAVDRGEHGKVDAPVLPAVGLGEAIALDGERPEHVARPLAPGDLGLAVERPDARSMSERTADGRHEREREPAPLDAGLVEAEVGREHDGPDVIPAEQVVRVEVEREERQARALVRAVPVEYERQERQPARPLVVAGRWLDAFRGLRAIGEEEEAEALVVVLPAARHERVEDVCAIVVARAALLVEREDGSDAELARLRRARELEQRPERRPPNHPVRVVARIAEERPELHVERRGGRPGGEREDHERRRANGHASCS